MPVTEAHRHGVQRSDDRLRWCACRATAIRSGRRPASAPSSIFDGRMRYDLQFAYKRMEQVKADKGYEGPVVVCAVYFVPIAGYIPYARRDQVSDEPARHGGLAGAGRPAPACWCRSGSRSRRRSASACMQATQFVSVAQPRAAAAGPRRSDRRSACAEPSTSQLSTGYPQVDALGGLTRPTRWRMSARVNA